VPIGAVVVKDDQIIGEGYGVRWRSSSSKASLIEIMDEVSMLKKTFKEVRSRLDRSGVLEPVYVGEKIFFTQFTTIDLSILDRVRSSATPTSPMHHVIKTFSSSQEISDLLDSFVSSGIDSSIIVEGYRKYVLDQIEHNRYVSILHVKPFSKPYTIGPGRVAEYSIINDRLTLSMIRDIRGSGLYDGLDIPKERGDYAVTFIVEDSYITPHIYFGSNTGLKGIYINVNTPIKIINERFGRIIAIYNDLEVDSVVDSSGNHRVIDLDRFEQLKESGYIAGDLYKVICRIVDGLKDVGSFIYSLISDSPIGRDGDGSTLKMLMDKYVKFLKDKAYIFGLS
jgi:hypothetical protein